MRGLYAIVDVEALERRGILPIAFAERVLAARPSAIQLRDKRGGARRTLELLRVLAPLAAQAGVPLFANDRPDLALLACAAGVHVGQDDVPVSLVHDISSRAGIPLRVGLSTHNAAQIEEALGAPEKGPDYLAIGPIFPTSNKDNPSPVLGLSGLGTLAALVRRLRPGLPIVAIGGITLENAGAVGALADSAAVIGGLFSEHLDDTSARVNALHEAIRGGGP